MFVGCLLVGVIALTAWVFSRPTGGNGPVIGGQSALSWVEQFRTNGPSAHEALNWLTIHRDISVPYLAAVVGDNTWRENLHKLATDELGSKTGDNIARRIAGGLHADVNRRRTAALLLGLMGDAAKPAVPVLIDCLSADRPRVGHDTVLVSNAIVALHQIAPENEDAVYATMKHLRELMGFDRINVAANAVIADLADGNQSLIPAILHSLRARRNDSYLSLTAATVMSAQPQTIEDEMLPLTTSTNAATREAALHQLLGSVQRRDPLRVHAGVANAFLSSLDDTSSDVRIVALEGVRALTDATSDQFRATAATLLQDPDYAIRLRAVDVLRQCLPNWPEAGELLKEVAETDPARIVRLWAAIPWNDASSDSR